MTFTAEPTATDPVWSQAAGRAVCVIGNLNIDLIIRNVPDLPRWGEEVAGTSHVAASSGQAGYLAMALIRLGVPTSVIANVGDDMFGRQIRDDLAAHGVPLDGVETADGQTGISVGIVRPDGERAFVSDFASLRDFDEALVARHWNLVAAAGTICLVGQFCLCQITPQVGRQVLERAQAAGKVTVLDTGWDPAGWLADTLAGIREQLRAVDIFLPNLDEAAAITGARDPAEAAGLLRGYGPRVVVVKCGSEGSLLSYERETHFLPALPVSVSDAVGAGDTFNAGFLAALWRGWDPRTAQTAGNAAAALYVSRTANRFPTVHDLIEAARGYGIALADAPDSTT